MKPLLVVVFLAAVASAKILDNNVSQRSAYGYLTRYGIPEAERIKKSEDEYLSRRASRIAGGSPARDAQFPYKAGIIADLTNIAGKGVCGGSLIKTNRVLTAAHCWWDGKNQAWRFTVVLGSNLLFSGGERILTSDIATHPLWIPLFTFNDIAIVRFEDVQLSESIQTVALPQGFDIFEDFHRHRAIASGFGVTGDKDSIKEDQYLSYANMTVISNEICNIAHVGNIRFSNICTSTVGGVSTCTGDSGGPLVTIRNGRPMQIGVASFSLALGCELGWPAVFSRVTSFLSFINTH